MGLKVYFPPYRLAWWKMFTLPPSPAQWLWFESPPKQLIFSPARWRLLLSLLVCPGQFLQGWCWFGAAAGVIICCVSLVSPSPFLFFFFFFPPRTQVPSGPEGAVRRNPASDFGPGTGVGYRDNPLRLPYPPQAHGQPSANSSWQISVQTHGIGDRTEQPEYLSGRQSKSTFFYGRRKIIGGTRWYSQHLTKGILVFHGGTS